MTGQNTTAVLSDEQRESLRCDLTEVRRCLYGNKAVLSMLGRLDIERQVLDENDKYPGVELPDDDVVTGLHAAAGQLAAMAESRLKYICEHVGMSEDELYEMNKP